VISYLGIDLEGALIYDANIKPDFTWDGKRLPFETNSFDTIISTEVLEHCPEPEVFLYEVFRVLKKGGVFFFTVPFLWNLHEVPHDEPQLEEQQELEEQQLELQHAKAAGTIKTTASQTLSIFLRINFIKYSF